MDTVWLRVFQRDDTIPKVYYMPKKEKKKRKCADIDI
jgi:hypothetical protein